MTQILEWLQNTYDQDTDASMVKNVVSYTKGFWKGLFVLQYKFDKTVGKTCLSGLFHRTFRKGMFTCCDHPHVTRTNNDHVLFLPYQDLPPVYGWVTKLERIHSPAAK